MANEFAVGAREKMLALRTRVKGNLEVLSCEQAPMPSPGIGDVLLQVHAASFTPTELL